jgi:hydroxypyruvate isomerase
MSHRQDNARSMTRRSAIKVAAGLAATGAAGISAPVLAKSRAQGRGVKKGNIKQAIAIWCFRDAGNGTAKWTLEELCRHAVSLNVPALDVVAPEEFPVLAKHGLTPACSISHMFVRGMNNKVHHEECIPALKSCIEASSAAGVPNVITFTGFLDTTPGGLRKVGVEVTGDEKGSKVTPEEGIRNCVEGYKQLVGLAEKKNVTLVLEPLNTRDPVAMKGHPGYQGNHVDICMDIIKQVGSPALKLLSDVYHIQIMDGDLIRRIRELKDYIGFVQIAGNPGRNEPNETQEINYPPIMKAFLEAGYDGYIAHEWIPTGDLKQSLTAAVELLDV